MIQAEYKVVRIVEYQWNQSNEQFVCQIDGIIQKLEKEVIRLLESGWRPQGGISVDVTALSYSPTAGSSNTMVTVCQAMIREREAETVDSSVMGARANVTRRDTERSSFGRRLGTLTPVAG